MLVFVTSGEHQYTVRDVLETRTSIFQNCIILLSYRDFLGRKALPRADYILTDLERLDADLIEAAAKRVTDLKKRLPDIRVLNCPSDDPRRLAVMRRLFDGGINRFRVIPVADAVDDLRFPVFIRRLNDHNGPLTELLNSREELDTALATLPNRDNDADLAITEFVDTRNESGFHRKLSYFRVGETYFPGAMNFSRTWVCKGVAGDKEPDSLKEKRLKFLSGNSHEDAMRHVFETACVTYGRADYMMLDGKPQVFEINTNPMVVPPEIMPREKRVYSRIILDNWLKSLSAHSSPSDTRAPEWVELPALEDVRLPAPAGHIARRAVRKLLIATDQIHRETAFMRPLRILGIAR